MAVAEKISISPRTRDEARQTRVSQGMRLVLVTDDGQTVGMSPNVQQVLMRALQGLADHGHVTIGEMPDELTSTVAAEVLGVSRPTLMKWARAGDITPFKVGSHTRFKRDDVFALRARRSQERADAFEALRRFDDEHPELTRD